MGFGGFEMSHLVPRRSIIFGYHSDAVASEAVRACLVRIGDARASSAED